MKYWIYILQASKLSLLIIYVISVIWLLYTVTLETTMPVSAKKLDKNHRITAADLTTDASAKLIGHYLRETVAANTPIRPKMVSAEPVIPVVPSGIQAVVNATKSSIQSGNISAGRTVRVQKDGVVLLTQGKVVAVPCDENRCAVIIAIPKAPAIDGQALINAEVVATPDGGSDP